MKKLFSGLRGFALAIPFALACFASPAHAQICNDPSGFIKTDGPIVIGDALILGPDCQHVQDAGGANPGAYFNVSTTCGAAGNGIAEDAPAIQNCINQAQLVGGIVFFPQGSYKVSSTLIATARISILGVGYPGYGASTYTGGVNTNQTTGWKGSTIVCSLSINCISLTSNLAFNIEKIHILYPTLSSSFLGNQALTINSVAGGTNTNTGTTIRDVLLQGCDFCLVINNIFDFDFSNLNIIGAWMGGIQVNSPNNPSFGDSTISTSTIWGNGVAQYSFHIQVNSGGGLRVINNKFNFGGANTACINLNPNLTVAQSIEPIVITSNSMEGCAQGVNITNNNSVTNNANVSQVVISGNQIWAGLQAIRVASNGTGQWINELTVVGNNLNTNGGANVALNIIDNVNNMNWAHNSMDCESGCTGTSNGLSILGHVTNSVVGPDTFGPTLAQHYSNSSPGVVILDPQGVAFTNIPAAAANGSQVFITNGAPASSPCTGASTGSTAFRQFGAWKCF